MTLGMYLLRTAADTILLHLLLEILFQKPRRPRSLLQLQLLPYKNISKATKT